MTADIRTTEDAILQAAHKMFKQKGLAGASVQDIADEAGTTKSMVNYYFRSKEKLFENIFQIELRNFFSNIAAFVGADIPLKEKIEKIVAYDIDLMGQFPDLPVFIINEANRNPEIVFKNLEKLQPARLLKKLDEQIAAEAKKGVIKRITAEELVVNIQSMTIFPILAKPMIVKIMGLSEKSYQQMLQSRKKTIVETIWQSIKL
jgi:TetR/AcrR family transcriptional regulator